MMSKAFGTLAAIAIFIAIIYGFWWFGKMVSYEFMYESFVEETIREMVKQEALNNDG
jgi:hypothetical protein